MPPDCRGAAAAVVVFDITNAESFTKAKSWVKELQRMGNPNMIMSLAGNKADLLEQRAVQTEDAKVVSLLPRLRLQESIVISFRSHTVLLPLRFVQKCSLPA